ncbi:MAG: ASCH domain-containing protein [bacterium]|nr:ASCH domain-containing protein [bacterium]
MSKAFGDLIPRILSGQKKIESRWSKHKISPWNKVQPGDIVYFKNSGGPIIARAQVDKVIQFDNLTPPKVKGILSQYRVEAAYNWAKQKKCCVLIFLKNSQSVKPFKINKSGYGSAAAWLCAKNVKQISL